MSISSRDDNPDIVCGLGTMGLEIVDQIEGIDAVIVPADGKASALLAGTCVAVKTLYPSIEIIVRVFSTSTSVRDTLDNHKR